MQSELVHRLEGMSAVLRSFHGTDLLNGRWFEKVAAAWLHHRRPLPAIADPVERDRRCREITKRIGAETALEGAAVASVATAATLWTAETGGLAGVVAIPAAALSMAGELVLRLVVHLELIAQLADLWGVPFDPGDVATAARLYIVVFGLADHADPDDPGRGILEKVGQMEGATAAQAVGTRLLGESLARNSLPYFGVGISAWVNWRLTQRVARTARGFIERRVAVDAAMARALRSWPEGRDELIEGIWFLFVADGRLDQPETMLLAHLLHERPADVRRDLTARFVVDEGDWVSRLGRSAPRAARRDALHLFEVVAHVEGAPPPTVAAVLRKAANALDVQRPGEAEHHAPA